MLCVKTTFFALVAQSVEQKTENLRVGGSIPPQGTTFCWCGSMAEQLICNQQVDGSTPFTSSNQKSKELSFRNRGRRSGRPPAPSAPFLQNPARPGDDPIRESGSPFLPVPRGAGRGGFKPLLTAEDLRLSSRSGARPIDLS